MDGFADDDDLITHSSSVSSVELCGRNGRNKSIIDLKKIRIVKTSPQSSLIVL